MKIKKFFMKFISFVLVLALILPNITIFSNFSITVYANTNEDIIEDAYYELQKAICSKSGDWWTATHIDGCDYNTFHNEVQAYIREKCSNIADKELVIQYKQPVQNPVTGKYSKFGKADLYLEVKNELTNEKITYIWEIKPASYLEPVHIKK